MDMLYTPWLAQPIEIQHALNEYERSDGMLVRTLKLMLALLGGVAFIAGLWLLAVLMVILFR